MSDEYTFNFDIEENKPKKYKSELHYYLEFYEVLAEFLGCYAAEHIGEYTLNLEAISEYMKSDRFLVMFKVDYPDKDSLLKVFEEHVLEGYPIWDFFNISEWSKRMCEINFAKEIKSRKEEEARIYKCPTCQFLDLRSTSLGTITRCTGNTPKTRAEKFEREFLHGRNYDTLDEYKKDCTYYKKKEA